MYGSGSVAFLVVDVQKSMVDQPTRQQCHNSTCLIAMQVLKEYGKSQTKSKVEIKNRKENKKIKNQ